jgi:hypothetical protein
LGQVLPGPLGTVGPSTACTAGPAPLTGLVRALHARPAAATAAAAQGPGVTVVTFVVVDKVD